MGRYFVIRFFLFAGVLLVLWLVGLRDPVPLVLLSMVISAIIALVGFRGMRQKAATGLEDRVHNRLARAEANRTAEDDDEDD